jgi:hypothetical protein
MMLHYLLTVHSLFAHWAITVCLPFIHYSLTERSLFAYRSFIIRSLSDHCLLTVHSLFAHWAITVCLLFIHYSIIERSLFGYRSFIILHIERSLLVYRWSRSIKCFRDSSWCLLYNKLMSFSYFVLMEFHKLLAISLLNRCLNLPAHNIENKKIQFM